MWPLARGARARARARARRVASSSLALALTRALDGRDARAVRPGAGPRASTSAPTRARRRSSRALRWRRVRLRRTPRSRRARCARSTCSACSRPSGSAVAWWKLDGANRVPLPRRLLADRARGARAHRSARCRARGASSRACSSLRPLALARDDQLRRVSLALAGQRRALAAARPHARLLAARRPVRGHVRDRDRLVSLPREADPHARPSVRAPALRRARGRDARDPARGARHRRARDAARSDAAASAQSPLGGGGAAFEPVFEPAQFRVMLLGDSTANSLGWGLRGVRQPGLVVELMGHDGCTMLATTLCDEPLVGRAHRADRSRTRRSLFLGGAFLHGVTLDGDWRKSCYPGGTASSRRTSQRAAR